MLHPNVFGRDHFSTLAYLDYCCVEKRGVVERTRLRVDPKRHPGLAHIPWQSDYPTRLKDGTRMARHDDVDCIEDMIACGWVEWIGTGIYPVVRLTDAGRSVSEKLRRHKASGGAFSTFELSL